MDFQLRVCRYWATAAAALDTQQAVTSGGGGSFTYLRNYAGGSYVWTEATEAQSAAKI